MRTISLRIPEPTHRKLADAARRRGVKKSVLLREALDRWLQAYEKPGKSIIERADGLFGSLEGPGDLSCNPKHMEGFGR